MTLKQSRFLDSTYEITLRDDTVIFCETRLGAKHTFEFPLTDLDPYPSESRYLAISLFASAGFNLFLGLAMLAIAPFSDVEKPGITLWLLPMILIVLGALLAIRAHHKSYSYVIFHHAGSGKGVIHIRSATPTKTHVVEFTDILKERILSSRQQAHED